MTTNITATGTASIADTLFTKFDTKKNGYIDEADLKSASETNGTDGTKAAEGFKQLDSDSDGKVTKSELSAAVEKVGNELNAQMDQSRVDKAAGGAAGCAGGSRQGGGAPPAKSADSESASASKFIAESDTNIDGTVRAEEAAGYKKLLARAAEAKPSRRPRNIRRRVRCRSRRI